ncbi:branched-chain amino acid ABC transporter substrate-binding protein [Nocardioides cavernae]|uniref:Branched-chain amino acid ABC transporter substrate-binding protein n=1 Tax=Nocardioides cavernae TaxID=1921566 RepID=A0ABR8NCT8_9ACTN|nr:branched-chain amino acid ABC transporter substrate-binding protein [Nocardioides cavernae]MBD3925938.1 branched-chain amino acid ABC transporter substrate-binding protein [Nocardioides cavernae]MBM7513524.1 branched-chain amino acid transport system substrate-binding protein [Nocardioides cavernae]
MIRSSKTWQAVAFTAVAGLALTACGTTDDGGGSDAGGEDCNFKIGAMGALSGANASIVLPSVDGAELAIDQWDNDECEVTLERFDTEGDPAKATPVATQIAGDDTFIGVLGGAFSGETRATKTIYQDGGVPMISQSATATDLTQDDPVEVFHRLVPYDDYQGAAIAKYLTDEVGASKVFVVDNSEAYGEPLADRVEETLGDAMVQRDKTQVGQTDFAPTISKIESAEPDAIFYGGYIAEAAPLLKQIRDAGIEAPFVGGDGLFGADFGNAVGDAGEGAVVMCPCAPIEEDSTFAADFEEAFGSAPGAYAAEGYDAMSVFLAALDDGARTREEVLTFVNDYEGEGLSKDIAFDDAGDVPKDQVSYWAYKNVDGTLTPEVEVKPEG